MKAIVVTLLTLFTVLSTISAYAQEKFIPEYMLLKGELACQAFSSDTYQCLDLKGGAGASYMVILTHSELKKLGAVKGYISNRKQS